MPPQPPTTAKAALGANPTRAFTSQTSKHFRNKARNPPVDQEAAMGRYREWLQNVQGLPPAERKCFSWNNKTFSPCTCLSTVDREATASYMAAFCCLPTASRQVALKSMVQAANVRKSAPKRQKQLYKRRFYHVPITGSSAAELCLQSFLNLFELRTDAWKRLSQDVLQTNNVNQPIRHGNTGNTNRTRNSKKTNAEPYIIEFLNNLKETEGAPYATRFIRHITGVGIRNAEVDVVELPSSYTKRGLFVKFCYEQGKLVKIVDDKGNFGKVEDMKDRDDDEWKDLEPGPVCSFSSFHGSWEKNFPNFKIRPQSEDTCNACHIVRNAFRYKQPSAHDEDALNEQEELVLAAAQHVESARAQRHKIDARIAEAKASRKERVSGYLEFLQEMAGNDDWVPENVADLPEKEFEEMLHLCMPHLIAAAIDCIIIDFSQNMGLPHFGEEQPGAVYYFTPKSVFCFGVADISLLRAKLYAYCYEEDRGKKGGNNVASMVMNYLERTGKLLYDPEGNPVKRKRLTIAADNCGGQNKNNHVLRLAMYLVEKGFYEEVEILFYVKGHTKNVCDRCFNLMKKKYHKSNIYTFDSELEDDNLVNVLGTSEDVEVVKVVDQDFFKDWHTLQNKLYKEFRTGTITENHVFRVNSTEGATKVRIQSDCSEGCANDEVQNLKKTGLSARRRADILASEQPNPIPPPPLAEIKQAELYLKFRKYVPDHLKDASCPKPADEVLENVKDMKNAKAKKRGRKRKRAQQQN